MGIFVQQLTDIADEDGRLIKLCIRHRQFVLLKAVLRRSGDKRNLQFPLQYEQVESAKTGHPTSGVFVC